VSDIEETADTIASLTAEVERLKKETIGRQAHDRMQVREIKHFTAEVERKDAALKQAGTGLNAGLFQYAARDIHQNIVLGDEQYPWIRAMQIGLDAVTAALPPPPALKENNND
jgi:phosphopantetheinyl transferase